MRQRRHARTAQAVLDAALEIITESGIDALSMREIARRIEYSPSGLYEYYASKDEIIDALCQQGFERLTAQIERTVRESRGSGLSLPPAAQRLYESGVAYLEFARQNPQLYLLMFSQVPGPSMTLRSMSELDTNTAYGKLLGIIRAGVENGEFVTAPGEGVEQLAYSRWAHVHGLAMLRLTLLSATTEDIDAANRLAVLSSVRHMLAR